MWWSQRGHKWRHNMALMNCMLNKQGYTHTRSHTHTHTHTHVRFVAFPEQQWFASGDQYYVIRTQYVLLTVVAGLFAITSVSVCTSWWRNTVTSSYSHTGLRACACVRARTTFQLFRCIVLCILSNVNVHQLYRVSLNTHSSPEMTTQPQVRWSILSSCCWPDRHLLTVSSLKIVILN